MVWGLFLMENNYIQLKSHTIPDKQHWQYQEQRIDITRRYTLATLRGKSALAIKR
jgi:hypothetical protein